MIYLIMRLTDVPPELLKYGSNFANLPLTSIRAGKVKVKGLLELSNQEKELSGFRRGLFWVARRVIRSSEIASSSKTHSSRALYNTDLLVGVSK